MSFAVKHKNLGKTPEVQTRSPPLLYAFPSTMLTFPQAHAGSKPGFWFTARLPKPGRSQQSAFLTQSPHQLSALRGLTSSGTGISPKRASSWATRDVYEPSPSTGDNAGGESSGDGSYVYVNGRGEMRRVNLTPEQAEMQRKWRTKYE